MNMKNIAAINKQYFGSLKAEGKRKADFRGGRRLRTVMHEKASKGIKINPMIRIDHPNPKFVLLSIFDSAMGITTPPIEEPEMTRPNAAPLFLSKYCVTAAMAGNCTRPIETPNRIPWDSMNCQYSLQRLVIMIAKTSRTAEGRITFSYRISYAVGESIWNKRNNIPKPHNDRKEDRQSYQLRIA